MATPRNKIEVQVERCASPRSLPANRVSISYDLIDDLCAAIRRSLYLETAIDAVGVPRSTVYSWLDEGRDMLARIESGQVNPSGCTERQAMCVDLVIELRQTLAVSESDDVERMEMLARLGDFKAVQFRLERRAPQRWGRNDTMRIEGVGNNQGAMAKSVEPAIVNYADIIGEAEEFLELDGNPETAEEVDIIVEEESA